MMLINVPHTLSAPLSNSANLDILSAIYATAESEGMWEIFLGMELGLLSLYISDMP